MHSFWSYTDSAVPLGVVEIAGEAQHPFAFTTVQLTAAEAGRLVFVAAGLQAVVGFVAQSTRLAGGPRTTVVTTGCTYTGRGLLVTPFAVAVM